jgi:hypothetical protein
MKGKFGNKELHDLVNKYHLYNRNGGYHTRFIAQSLFMTERGVHYLLSGEHEFKAKHKKLLEVAIAEAGLEAYAA